MYHGQNSIYVCVDKLLSIISQNSKETNHVTMHSLHTVAPSDTATTFKYYQKYTMWGLHLLPTTKCYTTDEYIEIQPPELIC